MPGDPRVGVISLGVALDARTGPVLAPAAPVRSRAPARRVLCRVPAMQVLCRAPAESIPLRAGPCQAGTSPFHMLLHAPLLPPAVAMEFDIFFSISQTPVRGHMPTEKEMFQNFFEQVEAADRLGYGVAWLAESHLSSEVQKRNQHPVIPHWEGEVGLNCDMLQTAQAIFHRTAALAAREDAVRAASRGRARNAGLAAKGPGHGRIDVGSAVMNILQGGGPIAHAERIAYFATLAQQDERPGGASRKPDGSPRRIHVGFSAGRFDYMNRAHGYVPRDDLERAIPYPFLKGKIFDEATEVFCRLLAGETISSEDIPHRTITEAECRTDEDWQRIRAAGEAADRLETAPPSPPPGATAAGGSGRSIIPARGDDETAEGGAQSDTASKVAEDAAGDAAGGGATDDSDAVPGGLGTGCGAGDDVEHVVLPKWFVFEELKVVPQDWDRDLIRLVAGSHDPRIPALANRFLPCQVANLSITPPEIIERTHAFMERVYHPDGGPWKRSYMPRTVMVFLNEEEGLSPAERSEGAKEEAKAALSAYWNALTGTLDPEKIDNAAQNAVIGNAEEVAHQVTERYHPQDRLMLWFDFFNHDSARVVRNMEAWMEKVVPQLPAPLAAST